MSALQYLKWATFASVQVAFSVGTDLSLLSSSQVQDWLKVKNLHKAFGEYFESLEVDGQILAEFLEPQDVDLSRTPFATKAHVRKLFNDIKQDTSSAAETHQTSQFHRSQRGDA